MKRGKLIVIEGGEGCGKTTMSQLLYNNLMSQKVLCYHGREPGGIESAEDMRRILKNPDYQISSISELFGFCFARSEFYYRKVIPELESGKLVILDRSGWSSEAYQGWAGNVPLEQIRLLNNLATRGVQPDLGFVIDIDPRIGLKKESERDRFSSKGLGYHNKVRQGFLEIAKREVDKCIIVEYRAGDIDGTFNEIRGYIKNRLDI